MDRREFQFYLEKFIVLVTKNLVVGKDGFEPPNSEEDRFTVCCRWPLGYLPAEPPARIELATY